MVWLVQGVDLYVDLRKKVKPMPFRKLTQTAVSSSHRNHLLFLNQRRQRKTHIQLRRG